MSFWAYMLRCSDGTYYVGQTSDIERRVFEHQEGVVRGYTHSRRPVELLWCEEFAERAQAMEAERVLKGWSRIKKEAFLEGNETRRLFFSRPPGERGAPAVLADARTGSSLRSGKNDVLPTITSPPRAKQGGPPERSEGRRRENRVQRSETPSYN